MKAKRIIFVGMHNKEGMRPLDSRTKTGKIIDAVIKELSIECVKTNLCNGEEWLTNRHEIFLHNKMWRMEYEPTKNDVVVTLGIWVYENLERDEFKIIRAKHPASLFGVAKIEEYKKYILNKLNQYL